MHESFLVCSSTPMSCVSFVKYMCTSNDCSEGVHPFFEEQSYCGHQGDDVGGCQCRHKQAVPNTMQFVVRGDWICIFGVSTFKGLLSIPCDGRGARRPLGQSFRKSVGPASVKLSSGTCTAISQSSVRREKRMRRERATNEFL